MTKKYILKDARLLAKNYSCTLKTQNAKINGAQGYKIVSRKTGITIIENMTLISAWHTLLCGNYFENKGL